MVSGISNRIKKLSPKYIYHIWKRNKIYKKNKGKNLKLGLECSVNHTIFGNYVYLSHNVYINNSRIDNHSYIGANSRIFNTTIGKFCSIGPNVKILLGDHPTNLISTHPAFYTNDKAFVTFADKVYYKEPQKVIIGNDVWIGEEVMIPKGITIGDGAIIAARAVVTKDIEPYSIVAGIPAKHIRYRFDDNKVKFLLDFKWWNKNEKWLRNNYKLFLNVDDFFSTFS